MYYQVLLKNTHTSHVYRSIIHCTLGALFMGNLLICGSRDLLSPLWKFVIAVQGAQEKNFSKEKRIFWWSWARFGTSWTQFRRWEAAFSVEFVVYKHSRRLFENIAERGLSDKLTLHGQTAVETLDTIVALVFNRFPLRGPLCEPRVLHWQWQEGQPSVSSLWSHP